MQVEELRRECGFTPGEFALFREIVGDLLTQPENRTGIEGPGIGGGANSTRRLALEDWLDSFIDSGVGNEFWGPGSEEKWSYPTERARIRVFLRQAVMSIATYKRREQKAGKTSSTIRVLRGKRAPQQTYNPLEQEASVRQLLEQTQNPLLSTEIGHPVVPLWPNEDTSNQEWRRPPIPLSTRPRRDPVIIVIDSEDEKLEFALETRIEGDSKIKLLCSARFPSLANLIEKIRMKHRLSPEQEIRGIDVKIGSKVISADLNELELKYISGVVAENGGQAEIVVSIQAVHVKEER